MLGGSHSSSATSKNAEETSTTTASSSCESERREKRRCCRKIDLEMAKQEDSEGALSDDSVDDPDFVPASPQAERFSFSNRIISESESSGSEDEFLENSNANPEDDNGFSWTKSANDASGFSRKNFCQPFGLKQPINTNSPLSILRLILTVSFIKFLVEQSNLYALQHGRNLELTVEELEAFIGILIFMGFHQLPSIRLYWSNDENFHIDRVARVMSIKRFLKILRNLHLNDNEKMPARGSTSFDKLHKIRPLLSHFQKIFPSLFSPSQFISIDESMVGFKGRSTMKQYMPMKPVKRGFKIWVSCCAVTGYMLAFDVYTGKSADGQTTLNLGERVVTTLCRIFEGMFYCIFFDNFFSSIALLKQLLAKGLFGCGTIRTTRKHYPKDLLKTDKMLSKGQSDFVQCGDISISKWKDHGKKSVSVISNMHNPSKITKVLRRNNHGIREDVDCPQMIADYNRYMGGVDNFDQLMANYSIIQKSRRWWLKLFYYFLDCSIVNSFILYKFEMKNKKQKHLTHLQFRSLLVNELIGSFSSKKRPGYAPSKGVGRKRNNPNARATIENTVRLSDVGLHLPIHVDKYRRCAYCSTKSKEKRSNMICKKCNVALCKKCFAPFHSL